MPGAEVPEHVAGGGPTFVAPQEAGTTDERRAVAVRKAAYAVSC